MRTLRRWVAVVLAGWLSSFALGRTRTALDLAQLEREVGGRIGVAAMELKGADPGKTILEYRPAERFPTCSTFKLLLAADILRQSPTPGHELSRRLSFTAADLPGHAPVTRAHLAAGQMTIGDLAAAAIEQSDNGAANLLLATVGGPAGLTAFVRQLGDPVTRFDRWETALNSAEPGDPRDTSTPSAFGRDFAQVVFGTVLSAADRARLIDWLVACATGGDRIRAGLPPGWRVGDKTGTGEHGAINDVAVVWPPARAPVLIVVFCVGSAHPAKQLEAAIAQIAAAVAAQLQDRR